MYTPEKTVSFENLVGWSAAQAMQGRPLLEGPLRMALSIDVQIPASWSMKKQGAAQRGEVMPTTKPDASNVLKAVEDAMNGVVFKDDVQIVSVSVTKSYSATPRVQVYVEKLDARGA